MRLPCRIEIEVPADRIHAGDDILLCWRNGGRGVIFLEQEVFDSRVIGNTPIPDGLFIFGEDNENTIQLIKQFDFKLGASTEPRLGSLEDDIYDFPRTCIKNNPVSLIENIVMALGIRQKYVSFFKSKIYKQI